MHPTAAKQIDTPRLVLRPLEPADAAAMVDVLSDPSLYRFTGGEPPDIDTLEKRYRSQVRGPDRPDELWFNWIITVADDGRPVGFVQATVVASEAELAWVVGVSDQGHGFATEASLGMRDWLISEGVEDLSAHIHPLHVASQAVATRLGMSRSGRLDEDGEEIWDRLTTRRPVVGDGAIG